MTKTLEELKEINAKLFKAERKLDKLYEQKREIINYLGLNKTGEKK